MFNNQTLKIENIVQNNSRSLDIRKKKHVLRNVMEHANEIKLKKSQLY